MKPKDLIGIPWRVAFALQKDGWYLRQDIIWAKPNPMPESVRDRCTKSHEYIFLLTKSSKYYYDYKAIMEPAISNSPKKEPTRGKGYGKAKGINNNPDRDGGFSANNGFRNKRDVWTVNTKSYKGAHFATFPEALIEPMILTTRKDAIIYDPFMGAGTTALVALKLGRQFIGSELNKDYCDLIDKRINL